jgi:hypothetical protein
VIIAQQAREVVILREVDRLRSTQSKDLQLSFSAGPPPMQAAAKRLA